MENPLMDCPICGSQVRRKKDGTCPACGKHIPDAALPANVAAIRASWIKWLENAPDRDVLRFHENVIDSLEDDAPPVSVPTPAA